MNAIEEIGLSFFEVNLPNSASSFFLSASGTFIDHLILIR